MSDITLAQALERIPAKRTGDAYLALTLACLYLQSGNPMPRELRSWLDTYLTNERHEIGRTRSLNMANLDVFLSRVADPSPKGRQVKIQHETRQFELAIGLGTGTAQKWRTKDKNLYEANVRVHQHLVDVLNLSDPTKKK